MIGCGSDCTRAPFSARKSACTLVRVHAAPREMTARMMLFLSRKVTRSPDPRCAQPSGYFIDQLNGPARKVRKIWLSGMSPAAAAFASACSAPAPLVVAAAVVVVAGTPVVVVAVEDCPPPPHPAVMTATAPAR